MINKTFQLQSDIFKALAHSRRLEIIYLLNQKELVVSDIYQMLDLPQANISQHLQILKEQNIVDAQKVGKQIFYKLSSKKYIEIADMVRELLLKQHTNCNYTNDLKTDLESMVPLTHDLVCGMRVSAKHANFTYEYQGEEYCFCASGCLEKFKKNPAKYIKEQIKE